MIYIYIIAIPAIWYLIGLIFPAILLGILWKKNGWTWTAGDTIMLLAYAVFGPISAYCAYLILRYYNRHGKIPSKIEDIK